MVRWPEVHFVRAVYAEAFQQLEEILGLQESPARIVRKTAGVFCSEKPLSRLIVRSVLMQVRNMGVSKNQGL